jgi:2,4-dienoyl-CoA reductase-like NADH-dependent reductase (Old Yellow Enzyme family)
MSTDIFSPFRIGGHTLKNRLGVAPMTRMSGGPASIPRQDVLEFLVRRARNGAALVFTEAIVTDYESAQGYPGQARLEPCPSCRCSTAAAWPGRRSTRPGDPLLPAP